MLDPLARHDLELSRRESPEEKLAQALELMDSGFRLKRAALQLRLKDATPEEVDQALVAWLCADG